MDIYSLFFPGIRIKLNLSVRREILDLALHGGPLEPVPLLVLPQGSYGQLKVLSDDAGGLLRIHHIRRAGVIEVGLLIDHAAVLIIFLVDNLAFFHHVPVTAVFMVAYL